MTDPLNDLIAEIEVGFCRHGEPTAYGCEECTESVQMKCWYRWLDPFGDPNFCGLPKGHQGEHIATWAVPDA